MTDSVDEAPDGQEWPWGLTSVQGQLVRHYRERLNLRHADVVAGLSEVGVEWKRTTLINLEQGRRKSISVPEIFALAYVFRVPPILLMVPVGNVEQVEVLAGKFEDPWLVAKWVEGLAVLGQPLSGVIENDSPLRPALEDVLSYRETMNWFARSDVVQSEILGLEQHAEATDDAGELRRLYREIEGRTFELHDLRSKIRNAGLIPSPLWPEFIDAHPSFEPASGDAR